MRKIIIYILSLFMVFAPAISANAASSWNVDSAKSSGSRVILGATNGGYKSAINIPPNLAKITKFGMRSANAVGLIQIAAGLINDGVDFVLDPANNSIKYKVPAGVMYKASNSDLLLANPVDVCRTAAPGAVCTGIYVTDGGDVIGCYKFPSWDVPRCNQRFGGRVNTPIYKSLSLAELAPQVVKDAQSSNPSRKAAAQKLLTDVAVAAVVAGDYDADLLAGAVPISGNETKPLIPAVPGSQTGDVDAGGMTGGDVGAQADRAREDADAARKSAQSAKAAATAAAEEARRLNDEAKDLINTAIDQAIKDAATAAAAAAAKDFAEAQEVANAAAIESAKAAAEAVRAADAKTAEAVRAADAAAAARDAAIAAGESAEAIAAAEAKTAASVAAKDAAKAAAEVAKEKAKEAEKAAEKAKAEAAKPFELPAFCSWATPVCDAIDWLKRDPSDVAPMPVEVDDLPSTRSASDFDVNYINFGGQCPVLPSFDVGIGGASSSLTFDMTPLCDMAVKIRPAVIAIAYFIGLGVIASAIRET